jgi:hypothetical protein
MPLLLSLMWPAIVWAQGGDLPDSAVTNAERQHAAMMILVLVLVGVLGTLLLLWTLRRRGVLKEERPATPLEELQDEIARRSDEMSRR